MPAPSPGFETSRAAVFAGLGHDPSDPANLLRVAIGFEERAVAFFAGHVRECPPGSVEREHVELLTVELERFLAGRGGIL